VAATRIPIVALVAFTSLDGATVPPGGRVAVPAVEALALVRARRARFLRADEQPQPDPRRRYGRRDLVAED